MVYLPGAPACHTAGCYPPFTNRAPNCSGTIYVPGALPDQPDDRRGCGAQAVLRHILIETNERGSCGVAQTIRAALGLTPTEQIWEIEVAITESTAEPIIRVISAPQEEASGTPGHVTIGGIDCAVEYMPHDPSFVGCVKAYLMAERQQMVLNSYIAQQDFMV